MSYQKTIYTYSVGGTGIPQASYTDNSIPYSPGNANFCLVPNNTSYDKLAFMIPGVPACVPSWSGNYVKLSTTPTSPMLCFATPVPGRLARLDFANKTICFDKTGPFNITYDVLCGGTCVNAISGDSVSPSTQSGVCCVDFNGQSYGTTDFLCSVTFGGSVGVLCGAGVFCAACP